MVQFGLRPPPPVIKNLLIANVLVFLAQFVFEQQGYNLEYLFALWPVESGNFKVWQLVTHMFMHGSIEHILFNMLFLYMFGMDLESEWGGKRFFQFYMICGIVAGGAQLLLSNGHSLGASGAIMGVMAGFAYLYPNRELYFMLAIPIKAKYAIPGLILIDLFSAIDPQTKDGVGHWAHVGGALAGICLVMFWNKRRRKFYY